jgi:hypothetical protein
VDQEIAALASLIAADASNLEGVSVDLKPTVPDDTLRVMAEHMGHPMPPEMDPSIAISIDGRLRLTLVFYERPGLIDQFVEGLNQLQDVIVESLLAPWPACPVHPHELVPVRDGVELKWRCPESSVIEVFVGGLNKPIS